MKRARIESLDSNMFSLEESLDSNMFSLEESLDSKMFSFEENFIRICSEQ